MTSTQKKRIGCLGSGQLLQAVVSRLEETGRDHKDASRLASVPPQIEYQLVRIESPEDLAAQASGCSLILYCDDQWHYQTQQKINQQCLSLGIPWLRAYCEFDTGIIGPCVDPSEAGCLACAELRRRAAMRDATDFTLLCQQNE